MNKKDIQYIQKKKQHYYSKKNSCQNCSALIAKLGTLISKGINQEAEND